MTNEVGLTAELGGIETGLWGEERIGLEVTGQLSRRAFGMTFDAALGSGNAVVADKVKIVIEFKPSRRPSPRLRTRAPSSTSALRCAARTGAARRASGCGRASTSHSRSPTCDEIRPSVQSEL